MNAKIQKWGNSLALRIPSAFAKSIGLANDTEVDLILEDDRLIVTKSSAANPILTELLAQITKDNIHKEVDFGDNVGREAW